MQRTFILHANGAKLPSDLLGLTCIRYAEEMSAAETGSERLGSLDEFLTEAREQDAAGTFGNETPRMLRVDVNGSVWLRPGAAIAYRGDLGFERLHTLDATGATNAILREAAPLVRASGRGRLYCGYRGVHARVVTLAQQSIVVSYQDLVAFEDALTFEPKLVGHGVSVAAAGLAVLVLSGHGRFALATHGRPLALMVSPGHPIRTDPHATLAWSTSLMPRLELDLSWRSAIGHGGGEPVQLSFDGTGFVLVQPYEDSSWFDPGPHAVRRVISLLAG